MYVIYFGSMYGIYFFFSLSFSYSCSGFFVSIFFFSLNFGEGKVLLLRSFNPGFPFFAQKYLSAEWRIELFPYFSVEGTGIVK